MASGNSRSRRVMYDEKSCCDTSLLRMIILFFSSLFYISSTAFVAFAVWIYSTKYTKFEALFDNSSYLYSTSSCLVIGIATFVVAMSGCWAVAKRLQMLLLIYTVLLLITMMMGFAVSTVTYAYVERLDNELGRSLLISIIRDHSQNDDVAQALQYLHREGRCCGSQSYEDWRDSVWWQNVNSIAEVRQRSFDLAVPDFCCRSEMPNCGRRDHPSNIYYNGCLNYLSKTTKEQLIIICGATFALALVQLFCAGFGVCLYIKWREFSDFKPVSTSSRAKSDATAMNYFGTRR